jgi:hypothetical protein
MILQDAIEFLSVSVDTDNGEYQKKEGKWYKLQPGNDNSRATNALCVRTKG